ncbi:MAG: hypothetical protein B1H05_01670 [Candidatus Cloacimonas sp. 4484_140]|nr:MAG: hypothetical protein B1H05_01670 [Candidatus Cloacimonas sp. 4484_140]
MSFGKEEIQKDAYRKKKYKRMLIVPININMMLMLLRGSIIDLICTSTVACMDIGTPIPTIPMINAIG